MTGYAEFLAGKTPVDVPSGMATVPRLPAALKPFQSAISSWALRRGRAAIFAGTGLGKTVMQLAWARAVADHEQSPVLILTPLAVAEQTVAEALKFGIDGVAYARDRHSVRGDIVVSNYERFDKFDIADFAGIVLDESSILKSHDGATRAELTEACQGLRWRLCCSATPAPNDYTELGQHSEFLGVMDAREMLAMFFVHDGSIRAHAGTADWRLKRHAERDFWRWLASWSVVVQHPANIGFDEPGYDLPPLDIEQVTVAAEYVPIAGSLFPAAASSLGERIAIRRDTVADRVAAAVSIIAHEPMEPWLVWCNLNAEADEIERAVIGCRQVAGSDPVDTKVARLLGFKFGDPRILCTKPSVAAHGMNYQHCARVLFVGLTDSFEQVFQAIRRTWRFGQSRPVKVYMVASELEGAVVTNLRRKEDDYKQMLAAMAGHMRDLVRENVIGGRNAVSSYRPALPMELPAWMA